MSCREARRSRWRVCCVGAPGCGAAPTVSVEDGAAVVVALDLVDRGVDFADALHVGKCAHCEGFASFDRRLVKAAKAAGHEDVRVREA